MPDNAKILDLVQYQLTKQELASLDDDYAALLATLCYALNEIRVVSSLYLSAFQEPKDEHVKRKWIVQRNTLLRMMNAKVFEALKGVHDFEDSLRRKDCNHDLLTLLEKHSEKLRGLKRESGYKISERLRSQSTNHYLPSIAKRNLKYLSQRASKSLYLHETDGDSFFPLGEEVVFDSAFVALESEFKTNADDLFLAWLTWTQQANRTVSSTFDGLAKHLVQVSFPSKFGQQRKPYVEPSFLLGFRSKPLALFHNEDPVKDSF